MLGNCTVCKVVKGNEGSFQACVGGGVKVAVSEMPALLGEIVEMFSRGRFSIW
jgi:hypothetical protein